MNTQPLPPWKLLGFDQKAVENTMLFVELTLDLWWSGPPASPDQVSYWAGAAVSDAFTAFALGAIGYIHPRPPLDDWRDLGRRCVSNALVYFNGEWRKQVDQARARADLHWSDCYRESLAMAASFSDWSAVDQLLNWPGPDLRFDEGTDDRTREDNAYQIWLASRLRGEPTAASASQRALIEQKSRRRPKMLLTAADALLAGDAAELSKALTAYLRHYRKQEIRPNRVDFGVCLDGTLLWHLARRKGLGETPLPEDVIILIARP